jgi:long-chain acyl-CoA synthetase
MANVSDPGPLQAPDYPAYDAIWQPLAWWAARRPDLSCLVEGDSGEAWSYGRCAEAVERLAAFLRDQGVGPGDRVTILGENSFAMTLGVLAATRAGAWGNPLNARLSAREVDEIRAHARPKVMLYTTRVSPDATRHAERHGALEAPELAEFGAVYSTDAAAPAEVEDAARPEHRVAALIYTSGTTGAPKGVMLTHRNLLFAALQAGKTRKVGPGDRVFGVLPVSHVYGLAPMFLGNTGRGACVHLFPRFVPERAVRALEEEGITTLHGVPMMYARLLDVAGTRGRPIVAPALRYMSIGAAPVDPALKHRVESMLGIPLYNGYGLTETSPTVSITRFGEPRDDGSVGAILDEVSVRIVGGDGGERTIGDVGEVWVKGELVMKGYYKDPERTAEVLTADGWFKTGDLGRVSAEGQLYLAGRAKELIIRSGFNVYPPEVEAVLTSHPDVAMSAVIGRPAPGDASGNEEVCAFVQAVAGRAIAEQALRAFVAERLAPYKRPSIYVFTDDMPASPAGKILKHKLRLPDAV